MVTLFAALLILSLAALCLVAWFTRTEITERRHDRADRAEDDAYHAWLVGENQRRRTELHHDSPAVGPAGDVPGPVSAPAPARGERDAAPATGPGTRPIPWQQHRPPPPHEHDDALWGGKVGHGDGAGLDYPHPVDWYTRDAIFADAAMGGSDGIP